MALLALTFVAFGMLQDAAPTQPIRLEPSRPKLVKRAEPRMPDEAVAAGLMGVVALELTVGVDGQVTDARVVSGMPVFGKEALRAVKQWRYSPFLRPDGAPIPFLVQVTMSFTFKPHRYDTDLLVRYLKGKDVELSQSVAMFITDHPRLFDEDERERLAGALRKVLAREPRPDLKEPASRALAALEALEG